MSFQKTDIVASVDRLVERAGSPFSPRKNSAEFQIVNSHIALAKTDRKIKKKTKQKLSQLPPVSEQSAPKTRQAWFEKNRECHFTTKIMDNPSINIAF
jgi:hypothetical protein